MSLKISRKKKTKKGYTVNIPRKIVRLRKICYKSKLM